MKPFNFVYLIKNLPLAAIVCVHALYSHHSRQKNKAIWKIYEGWIIESFIVVVEDVRTYVFLMLRTYVMILCNWLIFWQNALYLYLGRLRMCLNTSRNHFKIKYWSLQVCSRNQANSANSLNLDSCLIASRHLLFVEV